jgi:hypothetical protein
VYLLAALSCAAPAAGPAFAPQAGLYALSREVLLDDTDDDTGTFGRGAGRVDEVEIRTVVAGDCFTFRVFHPVATYDWTCTLYDNAFACPMRVVATEDDTADTGTFYLEEGQGLAGRWSSTTSFEGTWADWVHCALECYDAPAEYANVYAVEGKREE